MRCGKLARLKPAEMFPVFNAEDNKNLFKLSSCGSTPKTTARDESQLNMIHISNQFDNRDGIFKPWNDAGVAVSQSLTLRIFYRLAFDCRIPILKPLLTFKQKRKRSIWARDNENCSVDQWKRVIFRDDLIFIISFDYHGLHVWRKSDDKYDT